MPGSLLRWFRPATFVSAVLVVLVVAAAAHPLPGRARFAAEATVYLLLALACASWVPLRRVAVQLGWPRLAVLALMFAVSAAVQLRKVYGPAYPFVSWTMYGSANPGSAYARYDVSLASGRTIELPLTEIVPGPSPRAFLSHFNRELRRLSAVPADPTVVDGELVELKRLLTQVVQVYNERNPADPIRSVHVSGCIIPIQEYDGLESIACDPLLSFSLAPEDRP